VKKHLFYTRIFTKYVQIVNVGENMRIYRFYEDWKARGQEVPTIANMAKVLKSGQFDAVQFHTETPFSYKKGTSDHRWLTECFQEKGIPQIKISTVSVDYEYCVQVTLVSSDNEDYLQYLPDMQTFL
jgi:hypothetical protein